MARVAILTGFLGAGKTTLLNQLLKDPFLANAAVIINEFGDTGIVFDEKYTAVVGGLGLEHDCFLRIESQRCVREQEQRHR